MPRKTAAQNAVDAAGAALRAAAAATDGADDADINTHLRDLGPLFSLDGESAEKHDHTRVSRMEPIDEGHLDDLPPDADRADIKRRWGGGRFRIQAVTARGKIIATDSNVVISGDPHFENQVGQRRYDKWLEQQFGKGTVSVAGGLTDADEIRFQRRLDLMKAEAAIALEKQAAEAVAREAAEERRRIREAADRKAEREEAERREDARREREAAARAEEMRLEREARAEERRLEREARLELAAQQAEERRLEREQRGDPLEMFGKVATIVTSLQGGEGGPAGPWDAAVRLPEILEGVAKTGVQVYDEIQSKRSEKRDEKRRSRIDKAGVHLEGSTARKAIEAMKAIKQAGGNPEKVFEHVFDRLKTAKRAPAPEKKPEKPETAAATGKPAPSRPASGKVLRLKPKATRK